MDMSLGKLRELVMDREVWHAAGSWCRKESDMTEQLNWTCSKQASSRPLPKSWQDQVLFKIHWTHNPNTLPQFLLCARDIKTILP